MAPTPESRTVLNISKHDAIGRRFNNLDAAHSIARYGWNSSFCTWTKPESGFASVVQARSGIGRRWTRFAPMLDVHSGRLDRFYRNSPAIRRLPEYQNADLLHYHIVHERWLSAADWERLAGSKPVVWTWHDPYMLTGHCIYPLDCRGYVDGCPTCPNLRYHFPVRRDHAGANLLRKVRSVGRIDPMIVVASDYMRRMIAESVYGDRVRVRVVPFGVEWPAQEDAPAARKALGIPPGDIVVGFRAVYSDYKGLDLIQGALRHLAAAHGNAPITLIAFQEKGTLRDLNVTWRILEPGWVSDGSIARYYSAMDVFLMPSRAEAFGLMAIEAMAAGALPIVTYGTALPELVAAPVHSIAAPHSVDGLTEALLTAVVEHNYWSQGREERRRYARSTYGLDAFSARLADVYNEQYAYYLSHRRSAG
jgi:glycosyltransferase involved in cell wall biosynthesis